MPSFCPQPILLRFSRSPEHSCVSAYDAGSEQDHAELQGPGQPAGDCLSSRSISARPAAGRCVRWCRVRGVQCRPREPYPTRPPSPAPPPPATGLPSPSFQLASLPSSPPLPSFPTPAAPSQDAHHCPHFLLSCKAVAIISVTRAGLGLALMRGSGLLLSRVPGGSGKLCQDSFSSLAGGHAWSAPVQVSCASRCTMVQADSQ